MSHQIIYSSVSSVPMQPEQLETLLEQAQRSNSRQKITGALVYVDGFFLQILEGDRQRVQELMEKISRDIRHETVTVLQAGDVPSPEFADWDMAYVSATPEQIADWAGLSATTQLPELFEDLRQNRGLARQLAKRILAVLLGEPALQTRGQ